MMICSNLFMPFAFKAATKEVLPGGQQVGADIVPQNCDFTSLNLASWPLCHLQARWS